MIDEEEDYIAIPVRVLMMLNMEGYLAQFYRNVQEDMTHPLAFYACEAELNKYQLPARYTSYESFKAAKSRHSNKDREPRILFV